MRASTNSSGPSSTTTGAAEDDRADVGVRSYVSPLADGESCSYTAVDNTTGCSEPRTCQSCLTVAGCMIDAEGKCVSRLEGEYDPSMVYTIAIQRGLALPNATANATASASASADADADAMESTQTWLFPAGMVAYCSAQDAICQDCKKQNFWQSTDLFPDSRFCVGTNGCVCIDSCERQWLVEPNKCVNDEATPMATAPVYMVSDASLLDRLWRGILGTLIVFALVWLVTWRQKRNDTRLTLLRDAERRRRQEARRQWRHARANQLNVNALNLSGWETYRRELIAKENARLADGKIMKKIQEDEESGISSSDEESTGVDAIATPYSALNDTSPEAESSSNSGIATSASTTQVAILMPQHSSSQPTHQTLPPLSHA